MDVWFIYGGIALTCAGYALFLEYIHDLYSPDWTWVTVVGGNTIIGLGMLALTINGHLPIEAFYHLVGLNVAGGTSVIGWQLWQWRVREGKRNGTVSTGCEAAPRHPER